MPRWSLDDLLGSLGDLDIDGIEAIKQALDGLKAAEEQRRAIEREKEAYATYLVDDDKEIAEAQEALTAAKGVLNRRECEVAAAQNLWNESETAVAAARRALEECQSAAAAAKSQLDEKEKTVAAAKRILDDSENILAGAERERLSHQRDYEQSHEKLLQKKREIAQIREAQNRVSFMSSSLLQKVTCHSRRLDPQKTIIASPHQKKA